MIFLSLELSCQIFSGLTSSQKTIGTHGILNPLQSLINRCLGLGIIGQVANPVTGAECYQGRPINDYTSETRKKFLAIHADHKKWIRTPFISFTQFPQELQDNAEWREQRRGCQMITVLNPNVRVKKGLPIFNMGAEMRYYGIPDPYGKLNITKITTSVYGKLQWRRLSDIGHGTI